MLAGFEYFGQPFSITGHLAPRKTHLSVEPRYSVDVDAQRLRLETVAEWVQDEEAAGALRDWGCDYLQGALIGLATAERPWLADAVKSQPGTAAL